jgi:hypothetical protein
MSGVGNMSRSTTDVPCQNYKRREEHCALLWTSYWADTLLLWHVNDVDVATIAVHQINVVPIIDRNHTN